MAAAQARPDISESFITCTVSQPRSGFIRLSPLKRCACSKTNKNFGETEHALWETMEGHHNQTVHLSTRLLNVAGKIGLRLARSESKERLIEKHQPVCGTASLETGNHISHCSVGRHSSGDKDAQLAFVVLL